MLVGWENSQKSLNVKSHLTAPFHSFSTYILFFTWVLNHQKCVWSDPVWEDAKIWVQKVAEGGRWAKPRTCSFLHERCNYLHITSSNWTQLNWCWLYKPPEHELRFRQIALRTEWQEIQAHVVHLHHRLVLSRRDGTLICITRQPLTLFAPFLFQWSLFNLRI